MFNFFNSSAPAKKAEEPTPLTLLVILPKARDEIVSAFRDEMMSDGRAVHVIHCMWNDMSVSADGASGSLRVYVDIIRGPHRFGYNMPCIPSCIYTCLYRTYMY
jgi:hypothetical protein